MKRLSLKDAKTLAEVCSLKRDNYAVKNGWIMADHKTVTICKQRSGHPSEGRVTLTKKAFNLLLKKYTFKQKVK